MKIELEVREVYGVPTIYPVCETAKKFASLAKTKTLTLDSIKVIKSIGVDFDFVSCPLAYLVEYPEFILNLASALGVEFKLKTHKEVL